MGTTMHAHIEVKKDGKWFHYAAPNVLHDYVVYACINGTGREIIDRKVMPVAKINEIPDNISEVTRICLETDCKNYRLHGFGVLDCDDMKELQKQLRDIFENYDLEEDVFKTYIGGNAICIHAGFDDARIVFWFDH